MINFGRYTLLITSILFLVFFTSCVKRYVITLDKNIRKINLIDNKGYIINTYYEKYSNEHSLWFGAECVDKISDCKFSSLSLAQIMNLKTNNDENQPSKNIINNNISINSTIEEPVGVEEQAEEEGSIFLNSLS